MQKCSVTRHSAPTASVKIGDEAKPPFSIEEFDTSVALCSFPSSLFVIQITVDFALEETNFVSGNIAALSFVNIGRL
jgi:hypothetical protein